MNVGLNNLISKQIARNLQRATKDVGASLTRLSSGKRVASALDGAVDMSHIDKLDSQMRGMNQALHNINDAAGLTNSAQSSLDQMLTISYNLRELAQKAVDGNITSDERDLLEEEA